MDYAAGALKKHKEWKEEIQIQVSCPAETRDGLPNVHIPGVVEPHREVSKDVDRPYECTRRGNIVAVVADGTAMLGPGDIDPEAGMPVMEGKAILFEAFDDVDAVLLYVCPKDIDEIVRTVELLVGSFGGINLEDIVASHCFEIERRLRESLGVPVLHDDQHGTVIVVGAALINALKVAKREVSGVHDVVNGAGSADIACAKLLLFLDVKNLILCDRKGVVCEDEDQLDPAQAEMAKITNREHVRGTLANVTKGADFFLDVFAPSCVSVKMVKSMAQQPVISAVASPVFEIFLDEALAAGAAVVGTSRSDYPNQINSLLAFPGIFRGALDACAKNIDDEVKLAATFAVAGMIPEEELPPKYITPSPLDKRMASEVTEAMAEVAYRTNVARI